MPQKYQFSLLISLFFIALKVAKKIWNNLLEPVEAKAGWRSDNSYKLRCPSRSAPFISTFLNSQDDFDLDDDEVCNHVLNIDMFDIKFFDCTSQYEGSHVSLIFIIIGELR